MARHGLTKRPYPHTKDLELFGRCQLLNLPGPCTATAAVYPDFAGQQLVYTFSGDWFYRAGRRDSVSFARGTTLAGLAFEKQKVVRSANRA